MANHDTEDKKSDVLLQLTSDIVAAYVGKNPVSTGDLTSVIRNVYQTLGELEGLPPGAEPPVAQKPAVPIKKSLTPEYIVCLEDGKKLKMLKRYLRSRYGMTPDQYRTKWNLPADYPMVASNYAAQRSAFAKKIGLGKAAPATKSRRR